MQSRGAYACSPVLLTVLAIRVQHEYSNSTLSHDTAGVRDSSTDAVLSADPDTKDSEYHKGD